MGSQSREFFIDVAAQIGYTITITEYRTFVVGIDRVGDSRVYGATARQTRHAQRVGQSDHGHARRRAGRGRRAVGVAVLRAWAPRPTASIGPCMSTTPS